MVNDKASYDVKIAEGDYRNKEKEHEQCQREFSLHFPLNYIVTPFYRHILSFLRIFVVGAFLYTQSTLYHSLCLVQLFSYVFRCLFRWHWIYVES